MSEGRSKKVRGQGDAVRALVLSVMIAGSAVATAAAAAPPQQAPAAHAEDRFATKYAQGVDRISAWYVYTGSDNESHLKKIVFEGRHMPFFNPKDGLFKVKMDIPGQEAITFMEGQLAHINIYSAPANVDLPAHVSPGCEMFLILRGGATYLGKDGTTQEFGPGDLVIFEDTTGPGHAGRIGPEGFTAVNFGFVVQKPISALASDK